MVENGVGEVTARMPFTSARRRQIAVAEGPHCGTLLLVKGSPEALPRC